MTSRTTPLVLASSSPFRRALLERLEIPFDHCSPEIDEHRQPGEPADALVARLARDKARAVADRFPAHWIIGSDQVAVTATGEILGKPGTRAHAIEQLQRLSGERVRFPTALCLYDSASGDLQETVETTVVQFRELSREQIEHYVDREEPFNCAGSFRCEGLGIVLFESLEARDPNALIGLPLMALTDMLASAGLVLPTAPD
jgi:MAF protein